MRIDKDTRVKDNGTVTFKCIIVFTRAAFLLSSFLCFCAISNCIAALSPVCAITGGVLAQEVIKALSKHDAPHNNFFFFNGMEGSGLVDKIGV